MRKSFLKMAVLALVALGFVGCGGEKTKTNNIKQQALQAIEKLCDEGKSSICLKFVEKYGGDEAKVLAYLEKGCDGKSEYGKFDIASSCSTIAEIYAKKLEGDKAKQYYAKECERVGSCDNRLQQLDESLYVDSYIKYAEKSNDWEQIYKYIQNTKNESNREKALQISTKSCENGDVGACFLLYDITYWRDINTRKLYAKRICEIGSIKDCSEIGKKIASHNDYNYDIKINFSRYPIFEKRCLNGEVEFCKEILDDESTVTKIGRDKVDNIEAHYKNLCKSNNTKGCKEQQPKQDMSQEELAQSCENGDGESCASLGDMYEKKLDGKQTIAYYTKGCELGSGNACYKLQRIEKDINKATATFKKVCENNVGSACIILGGIYEAKDDYAQAMAFYSKGYELGESHNGYNGLMNFYRKTQNDYRDFESEAYWLGYHKGDSKKAKQSVKEVKEMRNKIRSELLKYLPNLCKARNNEACDILWRWGN